MDYGQSPDGHFLMDSSQTETFPKDSSLTDTSPTEHFPDENFPDCKFPLRHVPHGTLSQPYILTIVVTKL